MKIKLCSLAMGLGLASAGIANSGDDFKVLTWNAVNQSNMWDWTEGQPSMLNPIQVGTNFPANRPLMHDIDYDNAGNLYGVSISGDKSVYRINQSTGDATFIASVQEHVEGDFGYDPVGHRLVVVSSLFGNVVATQVDLTTNVASTLWTGSGLDDISGVAFDSTGQGFFIDAKSNTGGVAHLYSMTNTGYSLVGSLGTGLGITMGMDFNGADQLHVLTGSGSLFHINGTTPVFAGNVSNSLGQGVVGLAYKPVPEPASLATLGLGVAALLRRRKKLRK